MLFNFLQMQYPARIRVILEVLNVFGVNVQMDGKTFLGMMDVAPFSALSSIAAF